MSHNDRIYSQFILAAVPHIELADRLWLGNQLGKIYRKRRGRVHKLRLCSEHYAKVATVTHDNQVPGRIDKKLTNPQTGNVFWIGFNVKGKGNAINV